MKRFRRITIEDPPQLPPATRAKPLVEESDEEGEDDGDDEEWEDDLDEEEEFEDEDEDDWDDEEDEDDWDDEEDEDDWDDEEDEDDDDDDEDLIVSQQSRFARTLRNDRDGELDARLESKIRAGKHVPGPSDPWSAHFLYSTLIELGELEPE